VDAFGRESEASVHAGATLMLDAISPKVTKLTPAAGNYLTGTVAFTVKAEDNVSVTDLCLSYSLDEGATWVAFGKGTRGELDTTALPDGPVWVKAVAAENGCYYLDTQSVLKDGNNCLKNEYCNSNDGIHLGKNAYEVILQYIRTHAVPQ
jgi:hypothetical protein